jgi:hypothetical protein
MRRQMRRTEVKRARKRPPPLTLDLPLAPHCASGARSDVPARIYRRRPGGTSSHPQKKERPRGGEDLAEHDGAWPIYARHLRTRRALAPRAEEVLQNTHTDPRVPVRRLQGPDSTRGRGYPSTLSKVSLSLT